MTDADRVLEWIVAPAEARVRVDRFLTERGELGTRSQIRRLIDDERVLVEGRAVKPGTLVHAGQKVRVEQPPPVDIAPRGEAIALDVLFEDEWLLVIDKPAGLVVHPAPGHWQGTLVNALLHRWGGGSTGVDLARLGIVHRLDKDTSGVLVVAKDAATLEALARQFRGREVEKRYVALVHGRMATPSGVIHKPIGRHPVHRKRMAVRTRGREATTRWQVAESFKAMTWLRLFPETGRTHQLRVHLAAIGHPIVGDVTYGRGRIGALPGIERQALHAESICFRHPADARPLRVKAPLPADLAQALRRLRARDATP
jgi:23S rRNA pseudouridine1911/1915/1917 synthase